MTDTERMLADIEARLAALRQRRDVALVGLGSLDGQIQALVEIRSGLTAPPAATTDTAVPVAEEITNEFFATHAAAGGAR